MGDTTRPDDKFNIRDQFASAALSGLVVGTTIQGNETNAARLAYMVADAMIQCRKTMDPPVDPPVEEIPPPEPEVETTKRKR